MRRLAWAMVLTIAATACSGSSDGPAAPMPNTVKVTAPTFNEADISVVLTIPAGWELVEEKPLELRDPGRACTYTITVSAEIVPDPGATATDAARHQVPTGDGRVLDSGQRGSAAWRVVRHPGSTPIDIDAVRMQPLRTLSEQTGDTVWLATRVHAESQRGDECHSGSYRQRVGPAIGDLLATARRYP